MTRGRRLAAAALALLFALADGRAPLPAEEAKPRTLEEILPDLQNRFGKTREAAARELAAMGPAAEKAVPDLKKCLGDPFEPARIWSAIALSRIDRKSRDGLPILLRGLESGPADLRVPVVEALGVLGADAPGVGEALVSVLGEKALRPLAARGLIFMRGDAVPFLLKAVAAEDPARLEGIQETLKGLELHGAPVGLAMLDHPTAAVRNWASEWLVKGLRAKYPPASARALEVLAAAFSPAAPLTQEAKAAAVATGPDSVPWLAGLVVDPEKGFLRTVPIDCLERIGAAARGAVPALQFAATELDAAVSRAAARALAAIDPAAPRASPRTPKPAGLFILRADRAKAAKAAGAERGTLAVESALLWLASHQEANGSWDAAGFPGRCPAGMRCQGSGYSGIEPASTGLSLLAFLADGESHRTARYGAEVRRGLEYLLSVQEAQGNFGPARGEGGWIFNHLIANLAIVEAWAATGSGDLGRSAQSGVYFTLQCQNPYLAWRYGVRPQDNDTSVTGWAVLVLGVARQAGLKVDSMGFEGAKAWMDKVTDPEDWRAGYKARGYQVRYRESAPTGVFPADRSEGTTAQGILIRMLAGADAVDESVDKGLSVLGSSLPRYDRKEGTIDFHYWMFGTLAVFQRGDKGWKPWWQATEKALLDSQCKGDGRDHRVGSWDPVDPWSFAGGRVYATAVNCLTLETPYRYARIWPSGPKGK